MQHEDWWFHLGSNKDKIEMTLFAVRYAACLLIFVLGLKAPGIVTHLDTDYTNLVNGQDNSNDVSIVNIYCLS